jgi:hypothetical protein
MHLIVNLLKKSVILFIVLIFMPLVSSAQMLNWAAIQAGVGNVWVEDIEIDGEGNVYVTGNFKGAIDLDPGADELIYASNGGNDIFIQKLDLDGNLIWAYAIGGPNNDFADDLELTLTDRIVLTGSFRDSVDFNPGDDVYVMAVPLGVELVNSFVLELNTDGDFLWSKSYGGLSRAIANEMDLDDEGNIFSTGTFTGTVDLDPNAGIFDLTTIYDQAIYIQKLNNSGEFEWARKFDATDSSAPTAIEVNEEGEIYISGWFQGEFDSDPSAAEEIHVSSGIQDLFVIKLDASGELIWSRVFGADSWDSAHDMELTDSGNVIVTGTFSTAIDFGSGVGGFERESNGLTDIFALNLNSDGSTAWVSTYGGIDKDGAAAVTINSTGNIILVGRFSDTVDVVIEADVVSLKSKGLYDAVILSLDSEGVVYRAESYGGTILDSGRDVKVDADDQIYVCGYFIDRADLDPNEETVFEAISDGSMDTYVIKLTEVAGLEESNQLNRLWVYPNPTNGELNLELENYGANIAVKIYDVTGALVFKQSYFDQSLLQLNLANLADGHYYMEVSSAQIKSTISFVKH